MASINDILNARLLPDGTTATPFSPVATNINPLQTQSESRALVSSIKNNKQQATKAIKYTSKSTSKNFESLSETITTVDDFNVAKDAYRFSEVSDKGFVRAGIEQQTDQIISIKMKRVPKLTDKTKALQDNVFEPSSVGGYVNFFIQSIQTPKQERAQIVETFTTSWIYLFGQMTPIYTFSGTLLNFGGDENNPSESHKWANDFQKVYDEQIRGTKTIEKGAILELVFDKIIVQGYILNSNLARNAITPNGVPFSFSLAVVSEKYLGFGVYFDNEVPVKLTDETAINAAKPRSSNDRNSNLMTQTLKALGNKRGNFIILDGV